MADLGTNLARVFTDLHDDATRPAVQGNDLYVDVAGTGALNADLDALTGWDSVPSGIRAGWASRSTETLQSVSPVQTADFGTARTACVNDNGDIFYGDSSIVKLDKDNLSTPLTKVASVLGTACNSSYVNGQYIVMCTSGGYIYYSTNFGESFTEHNTGITGTCYSCAVFSNGDVIIFSATGNRISTDGCATWSTTRSGGAFASIVLSNDNLYIADNTTIVKKSTDKGASFTTAYTADANCNAIGTNLAKTAVCIVDGAIRLTFDEFSTVDSYTKAITPRAAGNTIWVAENYVFLSNTQTAPYVGYTVLSTNSVNTGLTGTRTNTEARFIFSFEDRLYMSYTANNVALLNISLLKIGSDNSKRFGFFHINNDGATITPIKFNNSLQGTICELNLNLKQDTTGTGKFYGCGLFVDANGFPTSVSADIGAGTQSYIGFGVEYENVSGDVRANRLVGIREFTYPASPDDAGTITVDTAVTFATPAVCDVNQFLNVRILKAQLLVQSNIYTENGNNPDYPTLVSRTTDALPTAVRDFIFNNRFTSAMYGEGGAGTTDGNGLVDNFSVKVSPTN